MKRFLPLLLVFFAIAAHGQFSVDYLRKSNNLSDLASASTALTNLGLGATTCTNQFIRSLNSSLAGTCASVSLANDVTGTIATTSLPPFLRAAAAAVAMTNFGGL